MNIRQVLKNYGLDEKESEMYLASLSLGESVMSKIANKANLKRPTAYKIFEELEQKGLMNKITMRTGNRFVATKPEMLITDLSNRLDILKKALPELKAIDNFNIKKPRVTYYHGVQGYKTAIEDSLLVPNITLRHIGSLNEIHKIKTKDYDLNYYMPKRIKNNIFLKSLYFGDTATEVLKVDQSKYLREIKLLPDKYRFESAFLIYGNKVILTSSADNLITIVIESDVIADGEAKKFDLIWDLVS